MWSFVLAALRRNGAHRLQSFGQTRGELRTIMKRKQRPKKPFLEEAPSRSERSDNGDAFLPDNMGTLRPLPEAEAESSAEEFVTSALQGESVVEDARDEVSDDEAGGPFIVLDEDARLPRVPEEGNPEREGHEPISRAQRLQAGRWAARKA
jgi:hypothetical protein